MLPKIQQTSTISTNEKLPSGRNVKVRPFYGREEKILLTAKVSTNTIDWFDASTQVFSSCTGEDVSDFAMADFEALYLLIYANSVSDKISAAFACNECKKPIEVSIPVSSIKIPKYDGALIKIPLGSSEDKEPITLVLNPLRVKDARAGAVVEQDSELEMIYSSLDGVYVGSEVSEDFSKEDFFAWLLDQQHAYSLAVKSLYNREPMSLKRNWRCECGHDNTTEVKGFTSFFHSSTLIAT